MRHGQRALDDLLSESEYWYPNERASHQVMTAYTRMAAAVNATECLSNHAQLQNCLGTDVRSSYSRIYLWLVACCNCIKASRLREWAINREGILKVLPAHEHVESTYKGMLPKRLLEALASSCSWNGSGLLWAPAVVGCMVQFNVVGKVG